MQVVLLGGSYPNLADGCLPNGHCGTPQNISRTSDDCHYGDSRLLVVAGLLVVRPFIVPGDNRTMNWKFWQKREANVILKAEIRPSGDIGFSYEFPTHYGDAERRTAAYHLACLLASSGNGNLIVPLTDALVYEGTRQGKQDFVDSTIAILSKLPKEPVRKKDPNRIIVSPRRALRPN